jgi:hypothetical protein
MIKKTVDNRGVTFQSPKLKFISVVKQYKADSLFCLHLNMSDTREHFETTGSAVLLEDGTVLTDDLTKVHCTQERTEINGGLSASMVHAGQYLLEGYFHITNENIAKLTSKKIVSITVHDAVQKISDKEATKIRGYIRCMRSKYGFDN